MAAEARSMRHVRLVGVEVKDDAGYRLYRAGMIPILHAHGGDFGYDFVVSAVLKSETEAPMNRVFTMHFPDESAGDRFFADPAYLAVRARFFTPSVGAVTTISSFDEPSPR
ncbi:MAG: DUF1330 domain-containing protein [Byssovorax sp.]